MATEVDSSGTLSILVFLGITLVYFVLKYYMSESGSMNLYTIIYYLAVIVTQYFINLNAITERCGTTNWYLAFMVTLIPWIIIFGLLNLMLLQFPGWKAPFSNTIGYAIVSLAGVKNLLIDYILKPDFVSELTQKQGGGKRKLKGGASNDSEDIKLANEAVQHIYSNPSLLINEVTPQTFNAFWDRMKPLFKQGADEHKDEFYKLVELKDIVSEGVWYILTGSLITSISGNYMATAKCDIDASEMKKRHDEYEKVIQKEHENPELKTVYQVQQ